MEENTLTIENLFSRNRKYWIQYYGKKEFEGKNYHSFVVYKAIRSYWEQIEAGVNLSDSVLYGYLEELE